MPVLVKIDQEMRPWECSQTDTLTDANRFYNLSNAICYSYGRDNNNRILMTDNDSDADLTTLMMMAVMMVIVIVMMMMMAVLCTQAAAAELDNTSVATDKNAVNKCLPTNLPPSPRRGRTASRPSTSLTRFDSTHCSS